MERRTSKTTSLLSWAVGMAELRPHTQIAYTMATTGKSARDRFVKVLAPPLERYQRDGGPVTVRRAAGQERVVWDNGSLVQVLALSGSEFRSQEFDIVIVDEAGEADPEESQDALAAVLPTLGTSELGMAIFAGTAGQYRDGNMLWDVLQMGRSGDGGILEYAMPDDTDLSLLRSWETTVPLLERWHPGVGTLTTLDRLHRDWVLMKASQSPAHFAAEYGGIWGDASGKGGLFSLDLFAHLALEEPFPEPPRRFALAVSATERSASIVACWREGGEGRMLLLEHREGRSWLPVVARDLSRKYRVPVVLDPQESSIMRDVKQSLEQLRPAARVEVQTYEDVAAAHERMALEIPAGTVRHWNQIELTEAFTRVKKQQMGAKWKYAGLTEEDDITAARAATLALRFYDAQPRGQRGTLEAVAV